MDELIDVDMEGYLEGENEPDCVTLFFDLHGKELKLNGGNE